MIEDGFYNGGFKFNSKGFVCQQRKGRLKLT